MPDDRVGRNALDRALDEKEDLLLVYQPIHDASTKRIRAAEALLRQRRQSGEIRETKIITATAEKGPELFAIESFTMRRAWTEAAQWMAIDPEVRLNLNLSPREFKARHIVGRLKGLASSCGLDLGRLNLEITETTYIDEPEETQQVLAELRGLGVHVWLDDFGTKHSTLTHLLQFDVDGIKLPGEFVCGLPDDHRCRALTKMLVQLAHEIDLKVIAEGVETPEQLEFLLEHECDFIQGYLYSRPMPLPDLEALLRRSSAASPLPEHVRRDDGRGPSSPPS